MSTRTGPDLDRTLDAGVGRLLELQAPGGWWVGELESNVTMTAQHLLLLEFLRIRDERTTFGVLAELLARQQPDGLWSIYHGGEPDLNATIEAYAALRLAGLSAEAPQLAEARRFCEERGGIGAARVFTRIWLSLFGLWSWDDVPTLPVELVLLRPWLPVSSTRLRAGRGRPCSRSPSSCTTALYGRCPPAGRATSSGSPSRAARGATSGTTSTVP